MAYTRFARKSFLSAGPIGLKNRAVIAVLAIETGKPSETELRKE
jgi:hypothetical protein